MTFGRNNSGSKDTFYELHFGNLSSIRDKFQYYKDKKFEDYSLEDKEEIQKLKNFHIENLSDLVSNSLKENLDKIYLIQMVKEIKHIQRLKWSQFEKEGYEHNIPKISAHLNTLIFIIENKTNIKLHEKGAAFIYAQNKKDEIDRKSYYAAYTPPSLFEDAWGWIKKHKMLVGFVNITDPDFSPSPKKVDYDEARNRARLHSKIISDNESKGLIPGLTPSRNLPLG